MSGHDTPALRIASRRGGFWRCGVEHPEGPVAHPAGTFSPEEVERLKGEPMLIVDEIAGDVGGTREATLQAALDTLQSAEKPTVKTLEEASGLDLNATDRDAAWEAWQASQDA